MGRFIIPNCGFNAIRGALLSLNAFYVLVGILLIFTGAYAKSASIVTSVSILGGIITTGVFLVFVSLMGIFGTKNQHQAALFFYMVILSGVFLVQSVIASACLGNVSEESLTELVEAGWNRSSEAVIWDAEKAFGCCGLHNVNDGRNCKELPCWDSGCNPCLPSIVGVTRSNLSRVGMLGLFFSFTEIIGVWLTYRFRNTRDPKINPDLFFR